jgi:ketosteroid isomerase-like protein
VSIAAYVGSLERLCEGIIVEIEILIRNCFLAWQERNWDFVENVLADDFTFTSLYDDHLGKSEYKQKCWDSVKEIDPFEFITIMEKGNEAFVRYKGRINGKLVQNTEHFIFKDGKIKEVTVFFGHPEEASKSTENR